LTPSNFFGEPPNFETSFGYLFSWPIPRISLDHIPDFGSQRWGFGAPSIFLCKGAYDKLRKFLPINWDIAFEVSDNICRKGVNDKNKITDQSIAMINLPTQM